METCASLNIPVLVLDRPNPNSHYIDGPILELEHKSFVGMHPVPVTHGMTIGEYAKMINGEGWLKAGKQCYFKNHPCGQLPPQEKNYNLPIKPSPNLPNGKAINLYPSLCFFEGTNVSSGRGTETQFQVFGSPFLNPEKFSYHFTPKPNKGAKNPKHKAIKCYGRILGVQVLDSINLKWIDRRL